MPIKMLDKTADPFPNFINGADKVSGWISNLIRHFIMTVVIHSCWNKSCSMFVKGAPVVREVGPVCPILICVYIVIQSGLR